MNGSVVNPTCSEGSRLDKGGKNSTNQAIIIFLDYKCLSYVRNLHMHPIPLPALCQFCAPASLISTNKVQSFTPNKSQKSLSWLPRFIWFRDSYVRPWDICVMYKNAYEILRTAHLFYYASVVPVKNSLWIPVIIPESCFETFQEIHQWIITKQTVDVPRCVRTCKLNIILWLMCKYLSVDTLVLNNDKKVWWNYNNGTDV
jgi:hypothetical protein